MRTEPRGVGRWMTLLVFLSIGAGSGALAHTEAGPALGLDVPERCERLGERGCPRFVLDEVDIEGLSLTREYVVLRELGVAAGDEASLAEILEGVTRVRNTGLFREVSAELSQRGAEGEQRRVSLRMEVDERWTLRPVLSFSQGGGTTRFVVGALDSNLLGRYLGMGATYERLGETNSFSFWAYDPRFRDERLQLGVNGGMVNRQFTLYGDLGQVEGGFSMRRLDLGAYVSREWGWWLSNYFAVSFLADRMSLDFVAPQVASLQSQRGVPPDTRLVLLEAGLSFGRIDEFNYQYDGESLSLGVDVASRTLGSTHDVARVQASAELFRRLPLRSNLGVRAALGVVSTEVVQHLYYLGGLDAIRGFRHDELRGAQYWLVGAEYRLPSLDSRWLVFQHVVFADAAYLGRQVGGLWGLSGASVGLGLRVIVPKIDGFIARIDYAFVLQGAARSPLSLGAGQFF